MTDTIKYREGYKYQLAEDYTIDLPFQPNVEVRQPFFHLTLAGKLTIMAGYAWDGPSGPALDTKNFMRGSLVHDALYQLMREGWLNEAYRQQADALLRQICREDGMNPVRAWWVYVGVRWGGSAAVQGARPTLSAP